jgi:hypothetical protein
LEARRLARLVNIERRGASDDPRALVGALVGPLLEGPLVGGDWYYARFLEQARLLPAAMGAATLEEHRSSVALTLARLRPLLPKRNERAWQLRLDLFGATLFALAADHERRLEAGMSDKARAEAEHAIIGALSAVLAAD